MDFDFDITRWPWKVLVALGMAILGCFTQLLSIKDDTKLGWIMIVSNFIMSGFAGLLMLMVCFEIKLSLGWTGIFCGMAGFMGSQLPNLISIFVTKLVHKLVDIVAAFIAKNLKVEATEKKQEGDE